jgi:hypothetical protein
LTPISIAATGLAGTVQLQWLTTGTGWQLVPATALFSESLTSALAATARRYQRGASLATSLNLTPAELVWLASRPDLLAPAAPAPRSWLNHPTSASDTAAWPVLAAALSAVLEYTVLKHQTPWRPGTLLRLAQLDPTSSTVTSSVAAAAGWKQPDVTALLTRFAATTTSTVNLLTRIAAAVRLATTAGIDAGTVIAAATNDPTTGTVAALEAALRARHDTADWRSVITPINNGIRIQQRDALVAHILTQANDTILAGLGIAATANRRATADDLYGYFLMDVQMQPICPETCSSCHDIPACKPHGSASHSRPSNCSCSAACPGSNPGSPPPSSTPTTNGPGARPTASGKPAGKYGHGQKTSWTSRSATTNPRSTRQP